MGAKVYIMPNRDVKSNLYRHGAYIRNKKLYVTWLNMIYRCENKKRKKYRIYGGRGIKVCAEWHNPNIFMDWAEANGYKDGLQIDRIDNDGNYCPENCRWATRTENVRNRRNTVRLTINGETKPLAEWCENAKVNLYTAYWWISKKGKEYAEKRLSECI